MTANGLYEIGSDSNVIVFVLDTFDTQIMEKLLADDPTVADDFTGFTYFRNSSGSMVPTRYGIPFLLSGNMPTPGQTFKEYADSRYQNSEFIKDIFDQGYDVGVYSDSVRTFDSEYTNNFNDYVSNIITNGTRELNIPSLLQALAKMSLYREAPWLLKPLFWFYTDEINRDALATSMSPYIMDDIAYSDKLFEDGLTIGEEEKVFRFIHLLGAHTPFVMGEDGHGADPNKGTDQITQSRGSLKVVAEYLRNLKKLGLYDKATVIITADHGYWEVRENPIDKPTSPVLLVKPRETANEAREPMKVSDVPTGHLDFNATVIDAVGADASKYGSTVFEATNEERPRYYWDTTSDGHKDTAWLQYVINGHVLDFSDWSLTGESTNF